MKFKLIWFQQNFEMGDRVMYNVRTERDGRQPIGDDHSVKSSKLEERAKARGASTWDESDIIAHHAEKHGETCILAKPPVLEADMKTAETVNGE